MQNTFLKKYRNERKKKPVCLSPSVVRVCWAQKAHGGMMDCLPIIEGWAVAVKSRCSKLNQRHPCVYLTIIILDKIYWAHTCTVTLLERARADRSSSWVQCRAFNNLARKKNSSESDRCCLVPTLYSRRYISLYLDRKKSNRVLI